ncbi:MAG: hypothetical protein K5854_03795, partial [Prevotella sp.]|nr:hypothetical protein [Prevotella sp.]
NWYLPSNGQWLYIIKNLGGMANIPYTQTSYIAGYENFVVWNDKLANMEILYAQFARNKINEYLTAVESYAKIFLIESPDGDFNSHADGTLYHCSSEFTYTKPYTTRFYDYGGLFVLAYRISDKRNGGYVRPVIAF